MKNGNPLIILINPSLGTPSFTVEDRLRSYLSLGTLASALIDKTFLMRYARRLGKKKLILNSLQDYPDFDIRILNLSLKPDQQSIRSFLVEFCAKFSQTPLIIGMTATSSQLDEAAAVARVAAEIAPAAIRIIGGAHVSVAAVDFLQQTQFQLACIGEGVETLAEIALELSIARDIDFKAIAGIAFKDESGLVHLNSLRAPLLKLDDYPFPSDSLDLFWDDTGSKEDHRHHLVYILSGYGCPHDCIFCAQRSIHDTGIRERSAENIFKEISSLAEKGFSRFAFVQETFLNRNQRIDEFCRLVADAGLTIEWTAEARADQLSYQQLKRMQAAGLRFIQVGVESGDPALLKKLGKHIDLGQVVQLRDWCRELRINTAFYLLVGLPGQGWQSVLQTALFIKDHPPYNRITKHASVSIAIPYPGTKLHQSQSVRLTDNASAQLSWPARNPAIRVNEAGEFLGTNYTETDDLTPHEILEAWLYLDDFCHFLLYAIHTERTEKNSAKLAKSMEFANRMFYMIQRRTIRDLIIRAYPKASCGRRKDAYLEITRMDQDRELHLKDVTAGTEPVFEVLARFLTVGQFLNGFDTMKWLGVGSRIKWMKICALVWQLKHRKVNDFRFADDDQNTGIELERRLLAVDESKLNRRLSQVDGNPAPEALPDINTSNPYISAFGIKFRNAKNDMVAKRRKKRKNEVLEIFSIDT